MTPTTQDRTMTPTTTEPVAAPLAAAIEAKGRTLQGDTTRSLGGLCYSKRAGRWYPWLCTAGTGWRHMSLQAWQTSQ